MSFSLRPYQQHAVDAGLKALGGSVQAGLIVMPTGAGKSLIIANIAKTLRTPTLVFQPSKEILEQNASKLLAYGFTPSIYSASMGIKEVGKVTLATIGSVVRHPEHFEGIRNVIVDECDLVNPKDGMYKDFFDRAIYAKVLGMTATPFRLSADMNGSILKFLTRTRPRVFTDVIHVTQIEDLIKQNFLQPCTYHEVKGFDPSKLKTNSTGADYDDDSVQLHFQEIQFLPKLVAVIERALDAGRKRILVFCRFVDDTEYLRSMIPGLAVVSGDTPADERGQILADFKAGKIQVVANVGVLVAGFDYPELDTVILARPSRSLRVYMQQTGRVVRRAPTKADAWVIDCVGLVKQFGKLEDLRLETGGVSGNLWSFTSRGRQITNVYLELSPDQAKKKAKFAGAPYGRPYSRQTGRW